MYRAWFNLLAVTAVPGALWAQTAGVVQQAAATSGRAPAPAPAQILTPALPRVGMIEFYGLRKVSEARIRQTLNVKIGDLLPRSKGDAEERLDEIPGVVESHLEAVCCENGQAILYVGVEERGAPHFDIREAPDGEIALPEEILSTYRRFLEALEFAVRRGSVQDDLTHGHSLMADPDARAIQESLPALANDHMDELRSVLRNSADEEQRAAATFVIGYADRKAEIVNDLQYALKDADPGVRNNAARNLLALSVLARLSPASGVKVSPTWFVEMANSLSWTDRNKAVGVLQVLTDSRDPGVLAQIRERALNSLVEMARWKSLEHALPAFVLVGRVAGLTDEDIQDRWTRGDRESVIAAATGKKSR